MSDTTTTRQTTHSTDTPAGANPASVSIRAIRQTQHPSGIVVDSHTDRLLWLNDIACADTELDEFFLDAGHSISEATLKTCRLCPVRRECLVHAYTMGYGSGYFAGVSPSQRRNLSLDEALELIERDKR
jgi:hypothetical protein